MFDGWRKEEREGGGMERLQEMLKLQVDVVVMTIIKHFNS